MRTALNAWRILRSDRSMRRTGADHSPDHVRLTPARPPHPSTVGEWLVAGIALGVLAVAIARAVVIFADWLA